MLSLRTRGRMAAPVFSAGVAPAGSLLAVQVTAAAAPGSIFNSCAATGRPPAGGSVKSPPSHALVKGKVVIPDVPRLPEDR
jgi:hypothetical protein